MYEYLFEQYPIVKNFYTNQDFKKGNLPNLHERYVKGNYYVRSNVDFIKSTGPKHLMKCLRNLSILCRL